ncbi:MAG: hypothetical protein M3Y58_15405 [Chloroflexota bacterium]|nr:hypothetical protein [Chloroflexota bacterium]
MCALTLRLPVSPAPGSLEPFAQHFDPLVSQRSQRQAFRHWRAALLLPAERNKQALLPPTAPRLPG